MPLGHGRAPISPEKNRRCSIGYAALSTTAATPADDLPGRRMSASQARGMEGRGVTSHVERPVAIIRRPEVHNPRVTRQIEKQAFAKLRQLPQSVGLAELTGNTAAHGILTAGSDIILLVTSGCR